MLLPEFSETEQLLHHLVGGESEPDRIAELAGGQIDWDHLLKLACFHRIEGLIAFAMNSDLAPSHPPGFSRVAASLAQTSKQQLPQLLRRMQATAEIFAAFKKAGIDCLLMKSESVSLRGYSDPLHRTSKDIDFLVEPADFLRGADILQSLGFTASHPEFAIMAERLPSLQMLSADMKFVNPTHNLQVELHWRLFANPALIDITFAELFEAHDTIKIGKQQIPVMGFAHLLVYLSAHGAMHSWFRLKWLIDLDRLLRIVSTSELELAREFARSQHLDQVFEEAIALRNIFFVTDSSRLDAVRLQKIIRYTDRIRKASTAHERAIVDLPHFVEELRVIASVKRRLRFRLWAFALYFVRLEDAKLLWLGKAGLPVYVITGAVSRLNGAIRRLFKTKTA